jgi:hypothetical protein
LVQGLHEVGRLTVPTLVRGDEPKVLALRLGTLSHAPAHASLELVRAPDSLVPVLQVDGHTHRVSDSEPAPVGSDARLDGSQRLAIRVT